MKRKIALVVGFAVVFVCLLYWSNLQNRFQGQNVSTQELQRFSFDSYAHVEELDLALKAILPMGTDRVKVQKVLAGSFHAFEGIPYFEDGNIRRYGKNDRGYSILYLKPRNQDGKDGWEHARYGWVLRCDFNLKDKLEKIQTLAVPPENGGMGFNVYVKFAVDDLYKKTDEEKKR
ncbi:MAG: hypothetical protein PHX61_14110 [Alphaproteobacteria bacterium]|nr:hypothetical protein [Alphaproteobacteria bacterium]